MATPPHALAARGGSILLHQPRHEEERAPSGIVHLLYAVHPSRWYRMALQTPPRGSVGEGIEMEPLVAPPWLLPCNLPTALSNFRPERAVQQMAGDPANRKRPRATATQGAEQRSPQVGIRRHRPQEVDQTGWPRLRCAILGIDLQNPLQPFNGNPVVDEERSAPSPIQALQDLQHGEQLRPENGLEVAGQSAPKLPTRLLAMESPCRTADARIGRMRS